MNYVDIMCQNGSTVRLVTDDKDQVIMSSHNEEIFEGLTSEEVQNMYYPTAKKEKSMMQKTWEG